MSKILQKKQLMTLPPPCFGQLEGWYACLGFCFRNESVANKVV